MQTGCWLCNSWCFVGIESSCLCVYSHTFYFDLFFLFEKGKLIIILCKKHLLFGCDIYVCLRSFVKLFTNNLRVPLQLYSTVTLRQGEKKHYNNKVDVYSFGIVFWELLTNRMPFEGMSNLQAAYAAAFKVQRNYI